MVNGIRTGDPSGFNKKCSSKFLVGSRVRQKHLKKAGGHISWNIVEITIKIKTIVQKPLMGVRSGIYARCGISSVLWISWSLFQCIQVLWVVFSNCRRAFFLLPNVRYFWLTKAYTEHSFLRDYIPLLLCKRYTQCISTVQINIKNIFLNSMWANIVLVLLHSLKYIFFVFLKMYIQ